MAFLDGKVLFRRRHLRCIFIDHLPNTESEVRLFEVASSDQQMLERPSGSKGDPFVS